MAQRRQLSPLDRIVCCVAPWLLRALHCSFRYRIDGEEQVEALLRQGRPVVVATWHGRILLGAGFMCRFEPLVMVSQSRDGELIARTIERLGCRTVRGSSSRGGREALLELIRNLEPGRLAVHVVDGPRGPAGEIKPGLIRLAQRTGAPIVPIYGAASHRWQARSWDRMQVPLPFARVHVRYGRPVEVPPELSPGAEQQLRHDLEEDFRIGQARVEQEARPAQGSTGATADRSVSR
jgi:hypothetical protein